MSSNRTKKKLIKLIKDPQAFVRDSPLGKATYAVRGQVDPEKSAGFDAGGKKRDMRPRRQPLRRSEIKEFIVDRAATFFVDDDSSPHLLICALEREYPHLVATILELCAEQSLLLSYEDDGSFAVPRTARDATAALIGKSSRLLRLVDKRSASTLYIEIQAWKEFGDHILAPGRNMISTKVWNRCLDEHRLPRRGEVAHLRDILKGRLEQDVPFEVDFVYTWVNADDPNWQKLFAEYKPDVARDSNSLSRFYNRNELMYSLRSLEMYAPWIRKVHIVSNCAAPAWLDTESDRVNWVDHKEIFDEAHLPTFSSHAIETRLHKIPGLSNHFVYSNDDFLLTRPCLKSDFFESNGLCKLKLEEWGSVNGEPVESEPDYLNGARNCQQLIERDFGVSPTQLHCHAPQALRIDILEEMEARYPKEFERTTAAKFRAVTDVAVTGFFFHHYAYVTGRAIKGDAKTMLIQQNHSFARRYASVLAEKEEAVIEERHLSVCVNDGADSHLNQKWNRLTAQFLGEYFPDKSTYEK